MNRRQRPSFTVSGTAIRDVTDAFLEAGGNVVLLTERLEALLPRGFSLHRTGGAPGRGVDWCEGTRSFSMEFYLYLVLAAKDLLDNPFFRYLVDEQTQLGEPHHIFERGPITRPPWRISGETDDMGVKDYLSMINVKALFVYVENAAPLPEFAETTPALAGMTLAQDVLELTNAFVPQEFQADRSLFEREELLASYEYLFYIAGFFQYLLNDRESVGKVLYYGFKHSNALARAVFLQPDFRPVEGIRRWQMRTNNLYKMEFREGRRRLRISYNLRILEQMNTFDLYRENCLRCAEEGISATNAALLELASGKSVRSRILRSPKDLTGFTTVYRWRLSPNSRWLFLFSGLSSAIILAGLLSAILLAPVRWMVPAASAAGFLVISGISGMAYYWRNRLTVMSRRFTEARRIISDQLDTLRQRTEELLDERNLLEDKVSERTRELQSALEQVKKLDAAKTNFLANVSHELRTPLTLMTVPFREIQEGKYGETLERSHEVFRLIGRNIARIRSQVTRLLDFTRLDLGTFRTKPEAIDVLSVGRLLIVELNSVAEKRGLDLGVENDTGLERLVVESDPSLLEAVLLNLLYNAVKFTHKGRVDLLFRTEGMERLHLTVRDTGIGIPENARERIFERFSQIDENRNRSYEGTGLGLALVKDIVALQGWAISVESRLGEGSSFTLSIPLLPADTACRSEPILAGDPGEIGTAFDVGPGPNPAAPDPNKDTVLIVEDNPDMGSVLSDLLSEDYNAVWRPSGEAALHYLDEGEPASLAVCDVMMPNMSGLEFLERLSAGNSCPDLPVILLTALDSQEDRMAGLHCGAVDYITKPFRREELLSKVNNLLTAQRAAYRQALRDREGSVRLSRLFNVQDGAREQTDADEWGITPAEFRVLRLLRDGLQDKEIAVKLSLSPRTVSTHLSHMYEKTGTQNRIELLRRLFNT